MEFNINPTFSNTLKTVARGAIFKYGMQTAKSFKSADFTPNLNSKELENQSWLTSILIETTTEDGQRYSFNFKEVVMTVTSQKNIVTTSLQGRDGTIKEFISNGDYNISLSVGVYGDNSTEQEDAWDISPDYPLGEVSEFVKLLTSNTEVKLQSNFLDAFKIHSAVVTSYNVVQETHSNRQAIEVQMLSDEPYEIMISKEN